MKNKNIIRTIYCNQDVKIKLNDRLIKNWWYLLEVDVVFRMNTIEVGKSDGTIEEINATDVIEIGNILEVESDIEAPDWHEILTEKELLKRIDDQINKKYNYDDLYYSETEEYQLHIDLIPIWMDLIKK